MAGIGRANKKEDNGVTKVSIEELERQFDEYKLRVHSKIKNVKDKYDLPDEIKAELRADYSKMAQIAKTIASRATSEEKVAKYEEYYKKASDAASKYGSVIKSSKPEHTMDDIKGQDNVKALVSSFVFMAEHPDALKHYGIKGGLGLLLYGPPGTGKTMFAEAIANKLNLPLFVVTPADIFKSYVGESEKAVKQIFDELEACPEGAILFVDECESIFSKRSSDTKDYKAAVTTELLQRINGFGVDGSKRILVGATNRPDIIDSAYLRYKRFSHLVHVTPPDNDAIRAIILSKLGDQIELSGITKDEVVGMATREETIIKDGETIQCKNGYYSAADICGIIEEACRLALEEMERKQTTQYEPVTREMFERAFKNNPPSISNKTYEEYANFRKGKD